MPKFVTILLEEECAQSDPIDWYGENLETAQQIVDEMKQAGLWGVLNDWNLLSSPKFIVSVRDSDTGETTYAECQL